MSQPSRMTKQRALILSELKSVSSHPTADELYDLVRKKMPHISLGTVYRNLDVLAVTNQVLKLEYAGFQKRFDGCTDEHLHVRCVTCGKIGDVEDSAETSCSIGDCIKAKDFVVTDARLEFFGLCIDCQDQKNIA